MACFWIRILDYRRQNVNMNLKDSIDIKPTEMDIPSNFQWFHSVMNDICGAFFEFPVNSRKGHRFFVGVFRNLSIIFCRQPEYPRASMLSDTPAFFIFRTFLLCDYEGSEKKCVASKKGTG